MKPTPTVRVTAGALKGRRLRYPSGRAVRPTSARTKESVFGSLGEAIRGVAFVDLFAGAGGVGIEAISRGASVVHFVENGRAALHSLEENLAACAVPPERGRIHRGDVAEFLSAGGLGDPAVRVVYADPPYDADIESLLAVLDESAYPHVRVIVVEHRGEVPERRWRWRRVFKAKRLGDTRLTYLAPIEGDDS